MEFPKPAFYPPGQVDERELKYAVIAARYQGKWLFCRHKDRVTWELPGGHREPGEASLETARRELYEETGATDADFYTVGVYKLYDYGLLCFAEIKSLSGIPDGSEIAEVQLFDALTPDLNLTYAGVHDQLYLWVQGWLNMQSCAGELWDVYDENRNLTGRLHRRGDFLPEGDYHLTVHIWVQDSLGRFLLTKRSPNKGFPNMWEATGGSALAGDDSLTAALREVREETGLILKQENGKCVISYRREDHFTDVWLFRQNFDLADVQLLEGETCDKMQASKGDILHLREDGQLVPFRYLDDLFAYIDAQNALMEMGIPSREVSIERFCREEDGSSYDVWKVILPDKVCVLKKVTEHELDMYSSFLTHAYYAPKLYASTKAEGANWLLIEYIPGNNLMRCTKDALKHTLDSLIAMQEQYWNADDTVNSFAAALNRRENRAIFLRDPRLDAAYSAYLEEFKALPRTLCHDDLLPFNVIVHDTRAVFIDWEVGGILPYPTSLARLIAHGEDEDNAFFYMGNEDKAFAIRYYYESFLKNREVSYDSYRRSLELALFYEYCEWVYVGYQYNETDNDRFRKYRQKALAQAELLGY